MTDTVFDKPRNNWEATPTGRTNNWESAPTQRSNNWEMPTATRSSQTGYASGSRTVSAAQPPKKDIASIIASKPKAVLKKKETPAQNKPYIAKSLDGLTKGMPAMAADGPGYDVGDRVSHIKYGDGTVLKIEQDPRDYKVTVAFDGVGNKIMYAAFAKLRKL